MKQIQRFAIDNIYCSSSQDRQFSFEMRRVNKPTQPYKSKFTIFNAHKSLPDTTSYFHVFSLGNLPPKLLNMLYQDKGWFKDQWIQVSTDMVARDYILKVYDEAGLVFPRQYLYYSFIDQNSLLIAVKVPPSNTNGFDMTALKYLHVYTNSYFQSPLYNANTTRIGIDYRYECVYNNLNKVQLQNYVTERKSHGGDVFIYVDGYYTNEVNLNIPDGSYVEIIYDQSIKGVETYDISSLTTFDSTLDDRLKYLIYRTQRSSYIDYNDDTELYVHQSTGLVKRGLYFYKHRDFVMRNVTDKDYSLTSSFVNTTAQTLSSRFSGSLADKQITLYLRHSSRQMPLVFNSMKLHELYKLPDEVMRDVVNNNNYSLDFYRAERLENSAYFKVASAPKVSDVTALLSANSVGYNGISYYYANSVISDSVNNSVQVAELYQGQSVAFEYDANGEYTGFYTTYGEIYTKANVATKYVELQHGYVPTDFGSMMDNTSDPYLLLHPDDDFIIVSAYFEGVNRLSNWEDITSTQYVLRSGNLITFNLPIGQKARVLYLKQLNISNTLVDLESGVMEFNLTEHIDKGTGFLTYPADVPPQSLTVILNKRRLTHKIDYYIDFPRVCITNKKYIDYSKPNQEVHFRMTGHTLDKSKINELEVVGFVNNGVLTRNRYYDMRDDRVISVFVDGKIKHRSEVRYSETDNTVRLTDPSNGLPYTVCEHMIPVKALTGVSTYELFTVNRIKDKRISEFFNVVLPEPPVEQFNVIQTAHFLYSPVISRMIVDILIDVIPSSTYMSPYDDSTILNLFDNRYRKDLAIDPARQGFQDVLVEIHPHLGNTVIPLTLHQYRFVQNAIRVLTSNKPDKVNISGYLSINA